MKADLEHILSFIKVVQHNSFTGAANELKLSKSVVSKHVTALEEALKSQLLKRSTRKLIITDEGKQFYEQVKNIPDQIEQAKYALSPFQQEPHGLLKIIAPSNFAASMREDVIPTFLHRYQNVTLDLRLERPVQKHINDDFDIIILWKLSHTEFPDYNLIAKKLFMMPVDLYATEKYLKKNGKPKTTEDLQKHNCFSSIGNRWPFRKKNGSAYYVNVPGRLQTTSDEVIKSAVLKDLGIAYSYPFVFHKELAKKKVVPILKNETELFIEVYAFYHPNKFLPLKIKRFIEEIQNYYKAAQETILKRG